MPSALDDKLALLRKHLNQLKADYPIGKIGIFGSYAKGRQTSSSDLDILIEFSDRVTLFRMGGLQQELSKLFGMSVDLVPEDSIKPLIREEIINSVVYA
ncbi:MAG: nucleotidyltransferase family protein [Bacteroidota bacterium]